MQTYAEIDRWFLPNHYALVDLMGISALLAINKSAMEAKERLGLVVQPSERSRGLTLALAGLSISSELLEGDSNARG